MTTLDLISPETSEIRYEVLTFSDSQPHIKIQTGNLQYKTNIRTRLSSMNDLLLLLGATEVLRQQGVKEIELFITYLLGARMDRRMQQGEPITLKIIADIINSQRYDKVKIFDPHSHISSTLINRSFIVDQTDFIDKINFIGSLFISPDAGASKKTEELAKKFDREVVFCTKTRDTTTGYLSNVKIDRFDLQGLNCLIIDDICDGGRTFINLWTALKEKGAGDVSLAISHGIFSQGLTPLNMFTNIYTTNSFKEAQSTENLTVIKLF